MKAGNLSPLPGLSGSCGCGDSFAYRESITVQTASASGFGDKFD